MYWYTNIKKSKKITTLIFFGVVHFFVSCESPAKQLNADNAKQSFFNIPGYFEEQVQKLNNSNPLVSKTVATNQEDEQKDVHISNWDVELSPFLSVDLNKVAYLSEIVKDSTDNSVTYSLPNDKFDLNKVTIIYNDGKPSVFEVERTTKNMLYETREKLRYEEGKSYRIEKNQKVILLGLHNYLITGDFK